MRWLSRLFRKSKQDAQLDSELRFHIEQQIADNIAAGMPPAEARRRALAQFGGLEYVKEETRGARGTHVIETLLQDIRYALRMLRKSPGFTAVAVLTLALGIGANTAIFSMLNGVLLSSLPYSQPGRLYSVNEVVPQFSSVSPILPVNTGNFLLWKKRCPAFSGMAAFLVYPYNMTGEGAPRRVYAALASSDFFSLLGIEPQVGHFFPPSEDFYGGNHDVVLTNQLWKDIFHSDPQILGKAVSLDGSAYTVAAVLPANFRFPELFSHTPELFIPLGLRGYSLVPGIGNFNYSVIARLNPGISVRQASVQLDTVEAELARKGDRLRGAAPGQFNLYAKLTPLKTMIVGPAESALWILMAAAGFVLLIVCANLASLLLVRNAGRSHEVAVRSAIGASPGRLAQQFFIEAFCLSVAGGAAGLFLASFGLKLLVRNAPLGIPRLDNVRIDSAVLWFMLAISFIATMLFALLPALRLARVAPIEALKSFGPTATKGKRVLRLHSGLVVSEIALCCVLLSGALLLVKSLAHVLDVNRWMGDEHVLAVSLTTSPYQYKTIPDRYQFYLNVSDKVQALPGVKSVGWVSKLPLLGTGWGDDIYFQEIGRPSISDMGEYRFASPGYLSTIGLPLIQGKWFSSEFSGQDVAVISGSVAKAFLRGRDPIGLHLKWEGKVFRVIGVVADVRESADGKTGLTVYVPLWSFNEQDETLVVRTSVDPRAAASEIRAAIWGVNSQIAIPQEETLEGVVNASVAPRQYETVLGALFAILALVLAALGLYGVISYSVSQRIYEIGIRMALGAQRRDILRLVIGQGGKIALAGIAAGIIVSLASTRLIQSELFGVTAADPLTFVSVVVFLLCVTLMAVYIPARRAMKVDPLVALRYE
jgi:putative ABC transport system permease protein